MSLWFSSYHLVAGSPFKLAPLTCTRFCAFSIVAPSLQNGLSEDVMVIWYVCACTLFLDYSRSAARPVLFASSYNRL